MLVSGQATTKALYTDMLAPAPTRTYERQNERTVPLEARKGEYFRRFEYLDGSTREIKLGETYGVETPFRHYEILTEYAIHVSRFKPGQRVILGAQRENPALSGAKVAAQRAGLKVSSRLGDLFAETNSPTTNSLAPITISLILGKRDELPKALSSIRTQQNGFRDGRAVKIERILLIEEGKELKGDEALLAEHISIEVAIGSLEEEKVSSVPNPLRKSLQVEIASEISVAEGFDIAHEPDSMSSLMTMTFGDELALVAQEYLLLEEAVNHSADVSVSEPMLISEPIPLNIESEISSFSDGTALEYSMPIAAQEFLDLSERISLIQEHDQQLSIDQALAPLPESHEPPMASLSVEQRETNSVEDLARIAPPFIHLTDELHSLLIERLTSNEENIISMRNTDQPSAESYSIEPPFALGTSLLSESTLGSIEISISEVIDPSNGAGQVMDIKSQSNNEIFGNDEGSFEFLQEQVLQEFSMPSVERSDFLLIDSLETRYTHQS